MHYYGAVYRPPSEAYSLIVQCTLGCSHNKCAFCNMYKDKKFSIRPVEEVLRDLAEARSYERRIERIFLADGDALILPMDYLLPVSYTHLVLKADLKALTADVQVEQEEHDEVVVIKPLFLVSDYQ